MSEEQKLPVEPHPENKPLTPEAQEIADQYLHSLNEGANAGKTFD